MGALADYKAHHERVAALHAEMRRISEEVSALDRKSYQLRAEACKELPPMEVKFTFTPTESKWNRWEDPALVNWSLHGVPAPTEEHKLLSGFPIESGGYEYVYNTATGRLSNGHGGGRIWVDATDRFGGNTDAAKAAAREFFAILEQFVKDNPKGGDVTELTKATYLKYQAAR